MPEALRTDLNEFLFSPIATDENGMHLTMLSTLARSGVDPWDEAARLAALSRESATEKVSQMLAGVPNGPTPGDQTASLAARLVAHLHASPRPGFKPAPSTATTPRGEEQPRPSPSTPAAPVRWAIYVVAALILMAIVYRTIVAG